MKTELILSTHSPQFTISLESVRNAVQEVTTVIGDQSANELLEKGWIVMDSSVTVHPKYGHEVSFYIMGRPFYVK